MFTKICILKIKSNTNNLKWRIADEALQDQKIIILRYIKD